MLKEKELNVSSRDPARKVVTGREEVKEEEILVIGQKDVSNADRKGILPESAPIQMKEITIAEEEITTMENIDPKTTDSKIIIVLQTEEDHLRKEDLQERKAFQDQHHLSNREVKQENVLILVHRAAKIKKEEKVLRSVKTNIAEAEVQSCVREEKDPPHLRVSHPDDL